jgi:hypothetical protein
MFLRAVPRHKRKPRKPVISIHDLAELCTVDYSWLTRNIAKSDLQPVFIGKKSGANNRLFYRRELIAWADENGWLK